MVTEWESQESNGGKKRYVAKKFEGIRTKIYNMPSIFNTKPEELEAYGGYLQREAQEAQEAQDDNSALKDGYDS